mgnify:CR=1 FL=1
MAWISLVPGSFWGACGKKLSRNGQLQASGEEPEGGVTTRHNKSQRCDFRARVVIFVILGFGGLWEGDLGCKLRCRRLFGLDFLRCRLVLGCMRGEIV